MKTLTPKPTSREARQALRALRDCTRIRLTFDSPAFLELYEHGYAEADVVEGNEDALDYIISPCGKWAAKEFAMVGAL